MKEMKINKKRYKHCPACNSIRITNDYHSPWVYIFAVLLFPIGLLCLAAENKNKKCMNCGVKFEV